MVFGEYIKVRTEGFSDIRDITGEVQEVISNSGVNNGIVSVFVNGSTASVSTIEFEPALVEDVREYIEKLIPKDLPSRHSRTWGDDNGFSHIRATLLGPGMTAPVVEGRAFLGTWQQIVVIDHDNRPRTRGVFVQVIGE